tara:strand:- start:254 stop:3448 length:3195 start_codon:yes stop_codon:yes gene_type:complete
MSDLKKLTEAIKQDKESNNDKDIRATLDISELLGKNDNLDTTNYLLALKYVKVRRNILNAIIKKTQGGKLRGLKLGKEIQISDILGEPPKTGLLTGLKWLRVKNQILKKVSAATADANFEFGKEIDVNDILGSSPEQDFITKTRFFLIRQKLLSKIAKAAKAFDGESMLGGILGIESKSTDIEGIDSSISSAEGMNAAAGLSTDESLEELRGIRTGIDNIYDHLLDSKGDKLDERENAREQIARNERRHNELLNAAKGGSGFLGGGGMGGSGGGGEDGLGYVEGRIGEKLARGTYDKVKKSKVGGKIGSLLRLGKAGLVTLGGGALALGSTALAKSKGLFSRKPPVAKPLTPMLSKGVSETAAKEVTKTVGKESTEKVAQETTEKVAKQATESVGKQVAKTTAKATTKGLIKKIPLIGAVAGLGFGLSRALKGDFLGAGMEVSSGLASIIPGAGTAASLGIDATLLARDVKKIKEGEGEGVDDSIIPTETITGKKTDGEANYKKALENKEKAVNALQSFEDETVEGKDYEMIDQPQGYRGLYYSVGLDDEPMQMRKYKDPAQQKKFIELENAEIAAANKVDQGEVDMLIDAGMLNKRYGGKDGRRRIGFSQYLKRARAQYVKANNIDIYAGTERGSNEYYRAQSDDISYNGRNAIRKNVLGEDNTFKQEAKSEDTTIKPTESMTGEKTAPKPEVVKVGYGMIDGEFIGVLDGVPYQYGEKMGQKTENGKVVTFQYCFVKKGVNNLDDDPENHQVDKESYAKFEEKMLGISWTSGAKLSEEEIRNLKSAPAIKQPTVEDTKPSITAAAAATVPTLKPVEEEPFTEAEKNLIANNPFLPPPPTEVEQKPINEFKGILGVGNNPKPETIKAFEARIRQGISSIDADETAQIQAGSQQYKMDSATRMVESGRGIGIPSQRLSGMSGQVGPSRRTSGLSRFASKALGAVIGPDIQGKIRKVLSSRDPIGEGKKLFSRTKNRYEGFKELTPLQQGVRILNAPSPTVGADMSARQNQNKDLLSQLTSAGSSINAPTVVNNNQSSNSVTNAITSLPHLDKTRNLFGKTNLGW